MMMSASKLDRKSSRKLVMRVFSFVFVTMSLTPLIKSSERPNFIVIMTDDQPTNPEWPELVATPPDANTISTATTPNLDRLREQSVIFNRAYTAGPKCSPSRWNLVTMRYCSRALHAQAKTESSYGDNADYDHRTVVSVAHCRINYQDYNRTLPAILQSEGYYTIHSGKWHLGAENYKYYEYNEGVQLIEKAGFTDVATAYYTNIDDEDPYSHNMEWVLAESFSSIDAALAQNKPFFLHMTPTLTNGGSVYERALFTFNTSVVPWGVLDEPPDGTANMPSRSSVWNRASNQTGSPESGYFSGVIWFDDAVGSLMDFLDSRNLTNSTLVLVTTDHGMLGKGHIYETGARVFQFVRFPDLFKGGISIDDVITNVDTGATILDMAGIESPYKIDGISWKSLVDGTVPKMNSSRIVEIASDRAVYHGNFKYITRSWLDTHDKDDTGYYPYYEDSEQLYNLVEDEEEQINLAYSNGYEDILDTMRAIACAHDKKTSPSNDSSSSCPVIEYFSGVTNAPTVSPPTPVPTLTPTTGAPTFAPTVDCALRGKGTLNATYLEPSWWRHQPLQYPEEISSEEDVMTVYVEVDTTRYIGAVNFTTRAYCVNGKCNIPAPTIRTKPGQNVTMVVSNKLVNDTKTMAQMEINTFEFPNHTNVHTHGMHIDPHVDKITIDIPPETNWTYHYHVPDNHAPGLFWWHSHMHGSSMLQVGGGMSGTWTVDPHNTSDAKDFYQIPEHVIVLQHFKFGKEYGSPCNHGDWIQEGGKFNQFKVYTLDEMAEEFETFSPNAESMLASRNPWWQYVPNGTYNVTQFWAVNGQYEPIMTIKAGELQILRVVNAGSGWAMHLAIQGCTTWLVARDGVYRDEKRELDSIIVPMASRADIMIQCPCEGIYYMESAGYNYGNQMDVYDEDDTRLLIFNVSGYNYTNPPANLPPRTEYLEDLMTMHRYKFQDIYHVDFEQDRPKDMPECSWVMNDDTYRGEDFYHHESNIGDYCEWTLEGKGSATHPYHQHVNHFQLVFVEKEDNTNGAIYEIGEWRDTIPALQGDIVIRFRNHDFPGPMIYHCHFLSHEDRGMMHINYVHPANDPFVEEYEIVFSYDDLTDDEIEELENDAAKLFAYITGSEQNANYLPTGKPSQYFGFPYVRNELDMEVSKTEIGYIFLNEIGEDLRQIFRDAVDDYMADGGVWDQLTEARAAQINQVFMQKNDSNHTINSTFMIEKGREQYYWDAQLGIIQAAACYSVYTELSNDVLETLQDIREGAEYDEDYDEDELNGDVSDGAQLKNIVGKCFAWITGDLDAASYIAIGRVANFFGFIKIRDESSNNNLRGYLSELTLNALDGDQLQLLYTLQRNQSKYIEYYDFSREKAVEIMWNYYENGELDEEQFILNCEDYGIYDAIIGTYQAESFERIRNSLSAKQLEYFQLIRQGYNDSQVGYLVSDAPTFAPTMAPTTFCDVTHHSPKIGYALDGYSIYGPFSCGGNVPNDLDDCNGHSHGNIPGYHYHTTSELPYVIGCFHGQVYCKSSKNTPSKENCVRKAEQWDKTITRQTLNCTKLDLEFASSGPMIEVPWSIKTDKIPSFEHCGVEFCHKDAAYSWDTDSASISAKQGSITCIDLDDGSLVISSTGIPDHYVAEYPLDYKGGTTGNGNKDSSKSIRIQAYEYIIPKYPVAFDGARQSVKNNSNALPKNAVIGFALNGVPFYSPLTSNSEPAFSTNNSQFVVQDLCYGSVTGNGQYNYRETPWCLLNDSVANGTSEWLEAMVWAEEVFPTSAPTPAPTIYCSSGHSEILGYAMDGYAIYGPYDCGGELPDDLDECNGHSHEMIAGGYHYHMTPSFPYILGCFHGDVLCDMVGNKVEGCLKKSKLLSYLLEIQSETAQLTCDSLGLRSKQSMVAVPWKVDESKIPTFAHCGLDFCDPGSAYSWNYSMSYISYENTALSCGTDRDYPYFLEVASNGIPDHYVAEFPLDFKSSNGSLGTIGNNEKDGKHTIRKQSYKWYIPQTPREYVGKRRPSVFNNSGALPSSVPVGFALNGVPFYGPVVDGGFAFNWTNPSFLVTDMCHGSVEKNGKYSYRKTPWCIVSNDTAAESSIWYAAHGLKFKLHTPAPSMAPTVAPTISKQPTPAPTAIPTLSPTPSCWNHSEIIGFAMDGYPIYGPFSCDGLLPGDLDVCNGHEHDDIAGYHYHTTPVYPYIIGCFHGQVVCHSKYNMDCVNKARNLELLSSPSDVSCDDVLGLAHNHTGQHMQQLPWSVNTSNVPSFEHCGKDLCSTRSPYTWGVSPEDIVVSPIVGNITCNKTSSNTLLISSNGVPDHYIGQFPLDYQGGTIGTDSSDMNKEFTVELYQWIIPTQPTPFDGNRSSILDDPDALPADTPIGFAVNGVPFVVSLEDRFNTSDPENFVVLDYCYGTIYSKTYYGYRSTPWCLVPQNNARNHDTWIEAHVP